MKLSSSKGQMGRNEASVKLIARKSGAAPQKRTFQLSGLSALTLWMSGQALHLLRHADPPLARWMLIHGDLRMDLLTRALCVAGRPIELQPRQFDVLAYLAEYAGRFVDESELLERLWRSHHRTRSSVVRVQVSLLRKALGEYRGLIETGPDRRGWRVR